MRECENADKAANAHMRGCEQGCNCASADMRSRLQTRECGDVSEAASAKARGCGRGCKCGEHKHGSAWRKDGMGRTHCGREHRRTQQQEHMHNPFLPFFALAGMRWALYDRHWLIRLFHWNSLKQWTVFGASCIICYQNMEANDAGGRSCADKKADVIHCTNYNLECLEKLQGIYDVSTVSQSFLQCFSQMWGQKRKIDVLKDFVNR